LSPPPRVTSSFLIDTFLPAEENPMNLDIDRLDFLKVAGIGSALLASGLWKNSVIAEADDFVFLQISDNH